MSGRGTTGMNGAGGAEAGPGAGRRQGQTFWPSEYSASRLFAAALSSGIVDSGEAKTRAGCAFKREARGSILVGAPRATDYSRTACLRT